MFAFTQKTDMEALEPILESWLSHETARKVINRAVFIANNMADLNFDSFASCLEIVVFSKKLHAGHHTCCQLLPWHWLVSGDSSRRLRVLHRLMTLHEEHRMLTLWRLLASLARFRNRLTT